MHYFKEEILKVHAKHNLTMYNHVYQRFGDKTKSKSRLFENVVKAVYECALSFVYFNCVDARLAKVYCMCARACVRAFMCDSCESVYTCVSECVCMSLHVCVCECTRVYVFACVRLEIRRISRGHTYPCAFNKFNIVDIACSRFVQIYDSEETKTLRPARCCTKIQRARSRNST